MHCSFFQAELRRALTTCTDVGVELSANIWRFGSTQDIVIGVEIRQVC